MAGILTIAAPCILLPLPILLGSSVGRAGKARPLFIALGFVIAFAILGLSLNILVQSFHFSPSALRNGAAVVLCIFAIFMIWPRPFEKLMSMMSGAINKAGEAGQRAGQGNWGGLLVGLLIGVIWSPCAGPILGSILTLVAQEKDALRAAILLVAYAIGAGLPMLAIAYGSQALTTKIKGLARYAARLQQTFGVLLILLSLAIFFQYDTLIQAKLLELLPSLNPAL